MDSNPPLEIRASIGLIIRGFNAKFDQGDVGVWGHDDPYYYTGWTELGGPVIGFHFYGNSQIVWNKKGNDLSFIVGDKCKPKYFGSRKLPVRLGERREMKFFWQDGYA